MTSKAFKASAAVAFVVFAASAAILYLTLSRTASSMTEQAGYGATSRAVKPMLVGVGTN